MTDAQLAADNQAWDDFMVRINHLNILAILAWSDIPYSTIPNKTTYLRPRKRDAK